MAGASLGRLDEVFLIRQFALSLSKQLAFLEDVLRLVSDGIPLSRSLEHMREIGDPVARAVAGVMLRGLDSGGTTTDAMIGCFNRNVIGAIGAAQQSGDLSETGMPVLKRLREQYESRKGTIAQLIKPSLYLLFAGALYVFFALQVWPRFEEVMAAENWPEIGQWVYAISTFIESWWAVTLGVLAGGGLVLRTLLRHWRGNARRALDKVWPFTIYRGLLAANVLDELGTLLTAGQEPSVALDTIHEHATPYTRWYLDQMRRRLDEGTNLSDMLDVGFFSYADMTRLKILAEYRNLRETMAMTGVAARNAILARVRRMARTLDMFGVMIVGSSFAALIAAVYVVSTYIATVLQTR